MELDSMQQVITNTVFKCYISVPEYIIARIEERGIMYSGNNPYVQVRVENCSVTIYSPEQFAADAIYSITINRKLVSEKVYNHVTFSWRGYHDADNSFDNPTVLDLQVASPIFSEISGQLAELMLQSGCALA